MMKILETVATQFPALVGFLMLVWIFVKYLEQRDEVNKTIHAEHIDERRQCREAIAANAKATADNAKETNRNTDALNNLAHVITTHKQTV